MASDFVDWSDEGEEPDDLEGARRIAERLAVLAIEGDGFKVVQVLRQWTDYKERTGWKPPWVKENVK